MRAVLVLFVCVVCWACRPDAHAVTSPNAETTTSETTDLSAARSAWMSAQGEGSTVAEARAAARVALIAQLVGDPRWLAIYPLEIHVLGDDVAGVHDDGHGHVTVVLGLSRARVAALVSDLEASQPQLQGPQPWRETQYAFVSGQAALHWCARRKALFQASCDPGDPAQADATLATLAASVSLLPEHTAGVPVDVGMALLRAPGAYAMWSGVPTAAVPVVVTIDGVSTTHVSNAAGHISLGLSPGDTMPASLQVRVDTALLLGPLAEVWRNPSLTIGSRPKTLRRWAMVHSASGADATAMAKFEGVLSGSGLGPATLLYKSQRRAISDASPSQRVARLAAVVRETRGRLDYVVVARAKAAFASRMGGDRVWFQAHGSLELLETWSGDTVAEVQASVRAAGVGDARAEAAARAKLYDALLDELKKDSRVPWPRD